MEKCVTVYIVPKTHAWVNKTEATRVMDHEMLMVRYEDYLKLEERLKQLESKT